LHFKTQEIEHFHSAQAIPSFNQQEYLKETLVFAQKLFRLQLSLQASSQFTNLNS
jgi:hypothetical protein